MQIDAYQVLSGVFVLMVAGIGWLGKRQMKRVDDHDVKLAEKVDRIEHNNTISSLRRDISKTHDKIDDCRRELSGQLTGLSKLLIEDARRRNGE